MARPKSCGNERCSFEIIESWRIRVNPIKVDRIQVDPGRSEYDKSVAHKIDIKSTTSLCGRVGDFPYRHGSIGGGKSNIPLDQSVSEFLFRSLASDAIGNLYGIVAGGTQESCSSIFELSPASGGTWTQTILYTFQNCIGDGMHPLGTLTLDSQGNIYGVQNSGIGSGRVYELKKSRDGHVDLWSRA